MTSRTAWKVFDLTRDEPERYTVPYKVAGGPERRGTLTLLALGSSDALRRAHALYAAELSATEQRRFDKTMAWGRPVLARDYRGGE